MTAWIAVAFVLTGCVVVPAGVRHGGGYGDAPGAYRAPGPGVVDDELVLVAPPPLQVEAIPVTPGPGHFWIGGYWTWRLGRHFWVGGHWAPHRPGWGWTPHRWVPHGHGWRQAPGYWQRR